MVDPAFLGTSWFVDAKGGGLTDKCEGATSWRISERSTHSASVAFCKVLLKNYVSFIIISGASWLKESCTRSSVANTGAFFDGSQKV